jgi:prepilin-type N-terminal cleavage/methylation domain-containing protein
MTLLRSDPAAGFTLVELLVVVTIIVVLLALLAPAIDKAVYQAELTTCAARMKGNATVLHMYAMDFKRYYPNPVGGRSNNSFDHLGPREGDGVRNTTQLMPLLEPRMPLKALLCPLLSGISLDAKDNKPQTLLFSNYYLFFAQRYTDVPGNKGIYKLGDMMEHRQAAGGQPEVFGVLMMDLNGADIAPGTGNPYAMTGHPDTTGTLPRRTWQDQLNVVAQWVTFARWQVGTQTTGDLRGPVDLNFTWEDGSVRRLDGLARQNEERTTRLPYYPAGSPLDIYVPPGR